MAFLTATYSIFPMPDNLIINKTNCGGQKAWRTLVKLGQFVLAMMPMIVVVNMKAVLKCMHSGGDNGGNLCWWRW